MNKQSIHKSGSSILRGYIIIASFTAILNTFAVPDLIGVWDFETGENDVWTNNLGGAIVGNCATNTYVSDRGNVLLMNNNTNSYVEVPNNTLLDLTEQITIGGWFYADRGPDIMFSKGDWDKAYTARLDDNSLLYNHINFHGRSASAAAGVSSSNAVPTGKWVHLMITFDVNASGNDTSFYTNGVLESTAEYGTALDSNTSPLRFGNSNPVAIWGYWNGMMDDIAIWGTPLTPAEIRAVYSLSADSKLKYTPADAQKLLDAYDAGEGAVVQIGNGRWRYSDSLTAVTNGVLVSDNGVVSLVMDASAGTGMVLTDSPDLVGVWDFENGVSDVWSNNLGGTAYGTATNAYDSERGNVLEMNNSEVSYVIVPNDSLLDITDHITLAIWFYAINGGPDVLWAKGNWDQSYSARLDDNAPRNCVNFHGRNAASTGVSSINGLPVGKWVHLMITFDKNAVGNDTVFYTNGVLESTIEYGSALDSNTSDLRFGSLIPRSGWEQWNGMMDDIAIWNDTLTPAEVRAVYSLSAEPDLTYSPAEAQQLFDHYIKAGDQKLVIGDCSWRYATGLSASEDGKLQAVGSGYELVMNSTTGEGLIGLLPQGTVIMIQ